MLTAIQIRDLIEAQRTQVRDHVWGDDQGEHPALPARRDFLVPEQNLPALREKIERLGRRAAKLGLEPIHLTVGDWLEETRKRDGRTRVIRKHAVHIDGMSPKLDGWVFGATLQHLDGGENIVRAILEPIPVAYRTAPPHCDHCKTTRRRIDTYLVHHAARGEWKQVGKNCIADFLGHANADSLARIAEFLFEALDAAGAGEDEGGFGGARVPDRNSLADVLALTACAIEAHGWVSRKVARDLDRGATADLVARNLWENPAKLREHGLLLEPTPAHQEKAAAALEWARAINNEDVARSDYLYNLRVIAGQESIETRLLGYACSIVAAHEREVNGAAERAARLPSAHVGAVGDKLEVIAVEIIAIRHVESDFGVKTMVGMVDAAGNRFKWWSTSGGFQVVDTNAVPPSDGAVVYRDAVQGDRLVIKGTVKKHDEYRGIKETVLTRCAVWVPKPAKTKRAKKVASDTQET